MATIDQMVHAIAKDLTLHETIMKPVARSVVLKMRKEVNEAAPSSVVIAPPLPPLSPGDSLSSKGE